MRKSNNRRNIWADPVFCKELKKRAVDAEMSLIEYTRKLGKVLKEENTNNSSGGSDEKKKWSFL